MKISIVTVCYNAAVSIEKTIGSVLKQDYPEIEYIIVDGMSCDGTYEIVMKYCSHALIIHEPDQGIYDAMNKGIKEASGDYIYFLNSGDLFLSKNTVSEAASYLAEGNPDILCANVNYVYSDNRKQLHDYVKYKMLCPFFLGAGITVCHQGIVARTSIMKQKRFNTHYVLWADQEFIAYCLYCKCRIKYADMILCDFDAFGFSAGADKKQLSRIECDEINRNYNKFWYYVFRAPKEIVRKLSSRKECGI